MAVDTRRIRKPKQIRRRRVLDRERATDVARNPERVVPRVRRGRGRRARGRESATTARDDDDDERGRRTDFARRRWNIVYVRGTVATTTAFVARASSSCSIARARAHFFREECFFARRKPLGRRATCRRRRADDADATAMTTIPLSLPPSKRTARDHRRRARKSAVRST